MSTLCFTNFYKNEYVLILILMEYALWDLYGRVWPKEPRVLILILMEYALWVVVASQKNHEEFVLILILMEYALWDMLKQNIDKVDNLS